MFRTISVVCLAMLAWGCHNNSSSEQAQVSSEGQGKPVVAVAPVIDSTINDLSWSLSDELTVGVYKQLSRKDKLLLVDKDKVAGHFKKMGKPYNPFGPDVSWVKKAFSDNEFVVFFELIEHEEVPVYSSTKVSHPKDSPAELNMSVRIRVIDVRADKPRIVLQELFHNTHYIPKQFTRANFFQVSCDDAAFSISPVGLAHTQLIREISSRVEDYILLAQSL